MVASCDRLLSSSVEPLSEPVRARLNRLLNPSLNRRLATAQSCSGCSIRAI